VRPEPSPATGPQPDASTSGVSGDSGVESIDQNDPAASSSVSGSAWRRGNDLSGSRAQVDASVRARSSSSAIRSSGPVAHPARLDEHDLGRLGEHVGEQLVVVDEPRQPALHAVEVGPSARRSHCSRPHGSVPPAGGPLADVVGRHQLARGEDDDLVEVVGRALVVDAERVSRSTSSPHRSMRIGASAVDGNTSTIAPRRRTRRGARPAPRGGSRTRRAARPSSSGSTVPPRPHAR
jgi:hypothetical protein